MALSRSLKKTAAENSSEDLRYPKGMFKFMGRRNKGSSQMMDYKCLLDQCGSKTVPTIISAGPCSRYNIHRHVKVANENVELFYCLMYIIFHFI